MTPVNWDGAPLYKDIVYCTKTLYIVQKQSTLVLFESPNTVYALYHATKDYRYYYYYELSRGKLLCGFPLLACERKCEVFFNCPHHP